VEYAAYWGYESWETGEGQFIGVSTDVFKQLGLELIRNAELLVFHSKQLNFSKSSFRMIYV
jgi:hypothetical protein